MKIENYTEQQHPKVIATFDLVLDQMYLTLRNWKVLKGKNNGWFAVPPSFKSSENAGTQPVFEDLVVIHDKRREEFRKALIEALKHWVRS